MKENIFNFVVVIREKKSVFWCLCTHRELVITGKENFVEFRCALPKEEENRVRGRKRNSFAFCFRTNHSRDVYGFPAPNSNGQRPFSFLFGTLLGMGEDFYKISE